MRWTMTESIYGVIAPVSRLTIDDVTQPTQIGGITLTASGAASTLTLDGLAAAFIVNTTRYAFPLQSADFVTPQTGVLELTCASDDAGRRACYFMAERSAPSVDGYGAFGYMTAAGMSTRLRNRLPVMVWIAAQRVRNISLNNSSNSGATPMLPVVVRG